MRLSTRILTCIFAYRLVFCGFVSCFWELGTPHRTHRDTNYDATQVTKTIQSRPDLGKPAESAAFREAASNPLLSPSLDSTEFSRG